MHTPSEFVPPPRVAESTPIGPAATVARNCRRASAAAAHSRADAPFSSRAAAGPAGRTASRGRPRLRNPIRPLAGTHRRCLRVAHLGLRQRARLRKIPSIRRPVEQTGHALHAGQHGRIHRWRTRGWKRKSRDLVVYGRTLAGGGMACLYYTLYGATYVPQLQVIRSTSTSAESCCSRGRRACFTWRSSANPSCCRSSPFRSPTSAPRSRPSAISP